MDELLAIIAFKRERSIAFMSGVMAAVGPEQANDMLKKFRGTLFPEEEYDDIKYMKKAKDIFEKLRGVDLSATVQQ